MLQRGSKTVPSGGQTKSDVAGTVALGRHQRNDKPQPDCPRFPEWIDSSSDPTDTEISHLVPIGSTTLKINRKRCCIKSTSSGYSSHSPPLSSGSHAYPCCPNLGIARVTGRANTTVDSRVAVPIPAHLHQQQQQQQQQYHGISGLAVIHEAETIPRPIWPCGDDDVREIRKNSDSTVRQDREVSIGPVVSDPDDNSRRDSYPCCGYCRVCAVYENRNNCSLNTSAASSSARQVLLELSRTLHSVIDGESDHCAEDVLRDISMTVARGIRSKDQSSSVICDDYTYRLSSSSSSAGGKDSVGVNPVNLRVYDKPKWLNVPNSSKSSSQCPYEGKFLLTAAAHRTSKTQPAFGTSANHVSTKKFGEIGPAVFLVPHGNSVYPRCSNVYSGRSFEIEDRKNVAKTGDGDGAKRTHQVGRLNVGTVENCGDKCPNGEPVYSTQLDGSDESSSYGAIDESSGKKGWNEGTKVFDRHLDFTLDGNRAERLGRAIANAKRKRQWCRGLTAIFGLVFFILSVIVVSLSVTRGRKVFGSM